MYACMCTCQYVCLTVCVYVRMSVCTHVCLPAFMYACMLVCMRACDYFSLETPASATQLHSELACLRRGTATRRIDDVVWRIRGPSSTNDRCFRAGTGDCRGQLHSGLACLRQGTITRRVCVHLIMSVCARRASPCMVRRSWNFKQTAPSAREPQSIDCLWQAALAGRRRARRHGFATAIQTAVS